MAHELSFDVDGNAEAFFALKPAWHNLGTVLDHVPNSEEAITAARLDWRVQLEPVQTTSGIAIPKTFATVRSDTRDVLGVVGDTYKIVQNRQAFSFLDSLIQSGDMLYESAGALRGGRLVWVLGRMPTVDTIAEGDDSRRYVLFTTSHDGTAAIHAIPTTTRVVCANTLRIALQDSGDKGIRHTGDVKNKLEYARRLLSQYDKGFTLFRDHARKLAETKFTGDQAKAYIRELFPEISEEGRAKTNRDRKVGQVRINFMNSRQQIASIKGTWWALLNSVTELVDHPQENYQSSSTKTKQERAENKMISVLDGTGADFKQQAFKLAVKMSA